MALGNQPPDIGIGSQHSGIQRYWPCINPAMGCSSVSGRLDGTGTMQGITPSFIFRNSLVLSQDICERFRIGTDLLRGNVGINEEVFFFAKAH